VVVVASPHHNNLLHSVFNPEHKGRTRPTRRRHNRKGREASLLDVLHPSNRVYDGRTQASSFPIHRSRDSSSRPRRNAVWSSPLVRHIKHIKLPPSKNRIPRRRKTSAPRTQTFAESGWSIPNAGKVHADPAAPRASKNCRLSVHQSRTNLGVATVTDRSFVVADIRNHGGRARRSRPGIN